MTCNLLHNNQHNRLRKSINNVHGRAEETEPGKCESRVSAIPHIPFRHINFFGAPEWFTAVRARRGTSPPHVNIYIYMHFQLTFPSECEIPAVAPALVAICELYSHISVGISTPRRPPRDPHCIGRVPSPKLYITPDHRQLRSHEISSSAQSINTRASRQVDREPSRCGSRRDRICSCRENDV